MEVMLFKRFLLESRKDFSEMLRKEGITNENYKEFFKGLIEKCESDFELETLTEVLKEEFQNYLHQV